MSFPPSHRIASAALISLILIASASFARAQLKLPSPSLKLPSFLKNSRDLEETAQAPFCPGGLAILPNGDYVISCHQFQGISPYKVMRLGKDGWEPYPNAAMNSPMGTVNGVSLDSVLGLALQGNILWMVDNGRSGETPPKLVGWDVKEDRLHRVIDLNRAALRTSHFQYIAPDPNEDFVYLTDPASGPDAALVVVNTETLGMRRVLQGNYSVVPEAGIETTVNGAPVGARRADGTLVPLMGGASPIAIGPKGKWVYYGPKDAKQLYRVDTEFLRDSRVQLGFNNIQTYCAKPVCDSITVDSKNIIYFGNIAENAITFMNLGGSGYLENLVEDSRLVWPGGLLIGPDERLHLFSNQLHRTKIFQGDKDVTEAPFSIFKIKPVSTGMFGR